MRPEDGARLLAAEVWNEGPAEAWDYFAFGGTPAVGYNPAVVPPALVARLAATEPFARVGDAMMIHRIPKVPATTSDVTTPAPSE